MHGSPTSAWTGVAAGQRTAKPAAVTGERDGQQAVRRVAAGEPAAEGAAGDDAGEVAAHQRDGGVGGHVRGVLDEARAPGGRCTTRRRSCRTASRRRARTPPGSAPGPSARRRRRVDRQAAVAPPGERRERRASQQRRAPARAGRRRERQRADQHDVGHARGDVGLGQRDRPPLAVVVGERGLDRDQQQRRRTTPIEQQRADVTGATRPSVSTTVPAAMHRRGQPEQRPAPERALGDGSRPARRSRFPRRTRPRAGRRSSSSGRSSSRRCGDDEPRRRLQIREPAEHRRRPTQVRRVTR